MERVVDLIDRQARIISNYRRRRPFHPRVKLTFAENTASNLTAFTYVSSSNTYTATLDASPAAIHLFRSRGIVDYTDGFLNLFNMSNPEVLPINLRVNSIKGTYVDGTIPTIVFTDIPPSVMTNALSNGYVTVTDPNTYTSIGAVNYIRYL